ncbi:non-hydrolyzing UDP-N-acetylglucosamine 2-epimerase [Micromonospora sp. DT46]|uniref:non-hydrolyzing UDP-N-acetylglucosamine 2-epimerase n=1 Tax=Micromonospora sp. DT46 TaxID=3393435 RepID=UPI003CEF0F09
MGKGKIAVIVGTRPEVIKLAPLVTILGDEARVIRTGQHFSRSMFDRISVGFGISQYDGLLQSRGQGRASQLGATTRGLDGLFAEDRPHVVVVQGDTTSAVGGALAANANDIPVVHVEAGLRSFDRRMPEEHNRRIIDCVADLCCAPTMVNRENLLAEGIPEERIVVTGSTVVDAALSALPSAPDREAILARNGVRRHGYVLATLHRPENVDVPTTLEGLLRDLGAIGYPVLLPLHPRTRLRITDFNLEHLLAPILVTPPLSYPELLGLAQDAALLVTDSGGLQEEASILGRPVVVVRRSTERPEIEGTFGTLVRPGPDLMPTVRHWLATAAERRAWLSRMPSPYGDGTAAQCIVDHLRNLLSVGVRPEPGPPASPSSRDVLDPIS